MSDEEGASAVHEEEVAAPVQETPAAAVATDVPKPAEKPTSELKVVIILKGNKAMLGVQSPDCDPVYKTMEGDLDSVLQMVPALVTDAKLQWAAAPRYPKADLPKPAAPAATTTSTASKPAAAKASSAQPKFF